MSAANYGSAGILPITWAYIALMGADGLTDATKTAVLAANYVAARLNPHFPVLYTGGPGWWRTNASSICASMTKRTGVTAEDVAKRLIDYGFHAPTLSFPVNGTLMVEPTESEDLAELDRFIDGDDRIRREIDRVEQGVWPLERSPLRQAPHTAEQVTADDWDLPYPRHTPPTRSPRCGAPSTGRRCGASTACTVTAISSAPAPRRKRSRPCQTSRRLYA